MAQNRKCVPSAARIAKEWSEKCIDRYGQVYDYDSIDDDMIQKTVSVIYDSGEPSCFICNKYFGDIHDGCQDFSNWNRTKRLQRAHIIPHALGGSDRDPSNYFLLCNKCHEESPNIASKEDFLARVYKLKSDKHLHINGIDYTKIYDCFMENIDDGKQYYNNMVLFEAIKLFSDNPNVNTHGVVLSEETMSYGLISKIKKAKTMVDQYLESLTVSQLIPKIKQKYPSLQCSVYDVMNFICDQIIQKGIT